MLAGPPQPWEDFQDFGHNHWNNSLIVGDGLHNISICGPGLIYGKGLSHGTDSSRPGLVAFHAEQAGVGNKAISLRNCRNVLLRDFSVLKGGPLRGACHRSRQPNDRQSAHRHRARRHRHRLLPQRSCLKLHRELAVGRRHLSQVELCTRLRSGNGECDDQQLFRDRQTTSLVGVIDGTWKRFPPSDRVPRNGRIKCGTESNGGLPETSRSAPVSSRVPRASRWRRRMVRWWKTSQSRTSRCARSATHRSFSA